MGQLRSGLHKHDGQFFNPGFQEAKKKRKVVPSDESPLKVAYLPIEADSRKRTTLIRDWRIALNRFTIEFEEKPALHILWNINTKDFVEPIESKSSRWALMG
ncbi:MAG: hypothetical protein IPM63_09970 [Acidobacteriota bacterium]|nr:MAG: hypothetical protein IPM63_09970 [Acidobacteriota bacterium]